MTEEKPDLKIEITWEGSRPDTNLLETITNVVLKHSEKSPRTDVTIAGRPDSYKIWVYSR